MVRIFACLVGAAAALQTTVQENGNGDEAVLQLFDKAHASPELEKAFASVYDKFLADFDVSAHHDLLAQVEDGVASFMKSQAFNGYKTVPSQGHCDAGAVSGNVAAVTSVGAFPGGSTKRVFGFDMAKLVDKLASKANGPAAASGVFPSLLAMQAANMGAGLIQGAISTVLQVVPPLVPPPVWINQPLPCMPMVTGHNCFGATPYLITAADFMTADVSDSQLDGVIAGFPALYKAKVGKTSDAAYKACFGAYMSMQCASVFPRCNAPNAREEPTPVGRVPMCFTHCLATLTMCPGFWISDIMGECSMVSVPPMCTMAAFSNFSLLPPQYKSFEDSEPTPQECPLAPTSLSTISSGNDFGLYSTSGDIIASPYGAAKVPSA